ncbi:hypothetical protein [Streptomyces sp. CT34]|uniref:hypothetical protein n=1 Tax=Streptomyces sp. CT34 TaxID=1553907 RepID=UPI00068F907B|nr:hypothetical protein [Streptomyces sp. CT34]
MGETTSRVSFRISFTEFMADPDDDDCRRRATTVPADRITFDNDHLILWLGDTERVRFPMGTVKSIEVVHAHSSSRREDPDRLRARYPNFGKAWSRADEERLLSLYRAGQRDYEVLASEFGRQPTAIRSRLGRLGLEQL